MNIVSSSCVEVLKKFLHPEYAAEVLFESARTLALRTAGEESFSARQHVPKKHELILMTSAEGADFAV